MSFDVNVGRSQPVIKAAANMNNDGGSGGNTGFMMRGQRKKEKKDTKSLFESDISIDSFEMASKLPKKDFEEAMGMKSNWIENFISKLTK
ncbi:hypothetical protein HDR58_05125 [bacterium]|nr:hypothetical protein [bacterium]